MMKVGSKIDDLTRSLSQDTGGMEKKIKDIEEINNILYQKDRTVSTKVIEGLILSMGRELNTSKYRVCVAAMQASEQVIDWVERLDSLHLYRQLIQFFIEPVIGRLGDGKLEVRAQAVYLLGKIWNIVENKTILLTAGENVGGGEARRERPLTSQLRNMSINTIGSKRSLRDELKREIVGRGFGHKTPRVREMMCDFVYESKERYPLFSIREYIDLIVSQLVDTNEGVRVNSRMVLQDIYRDNTDLRQEIVEKLTQKRGLRNDVIEEITTGQQRYGGSLGRGRNQYQQRSSSRNSGFGLRTQSQLSNTLSRQEGTLSRSGGTGIFGMTKMANTLTVRTPTPVSNLQTTTSNLTGNTRRAEVRADSYGSERGILTPQRTPNHKRGMNENTGSVSSGTFGAVQPLYVDSGKRVGREIMEFGTSFEGRETEDNWQRRERAVQRLRQIVAGNATEEYTTELARELRKIDEGMLKCLNSLRTSLSMQTIELFAEIGGSRLMFSNGIIEFVFDNLIRLCTTTKKIVHQAVTKALCQVVVSVLSFSFSFSSSTNTVIQQQQQQQQQQQLKIAEQVLRKLTVHFGSKNTSLRLSVVEILSSMMSVCSSFPYYNTFGNNGRVILESNLTNDLINKGLQDQNPAIRNECKRLMSTLESYREDNRNLATNIGSDSNKSRSISSQDNFLVIEKFSSPKSNISNASNISRSSKNSTSNSTINSNSESRLRNKQPFRRNIGFAKNSSIENRYFNDQPAAKLNLAATLNNYKVEIQNSPSSINNGIGDNADIFQALLAFSDNEGDEQEEVFKIAKRQLRNCNSSDQLDMYIEIATQILRTSSSIESKGVIFGFSVLKIVVKQKYADIKSINALRKAVWEVLRYRFIEGADSYSEFIRGTADHLLLSFVTTLDHNLVFEFFCDSFSRIPFPNSTSDHKYDQDLDPSRILHSTRVLSALLDLFSVFLGLYPEIHTTSTQLETMWMPILVRSAIYKKSLSVRNAAVGCIVTIKNLLGITDHDFSSALLSSSSHPLSPTLANSVEGDKERNDNEHGYEDDKQIARRVFLDCLVHSLPVDHRRTILLIL